MKKHEVSEATVLYLIFQFTLRQSNIAMENEPFEDVFPIENGDFPLLC